MLSRLGVAAGTVLAITGLTIVAGTASASAASGLTGTITITPDTGLTNGQTVTITGSGFTKSSIGNVLECNSDSGQPNVMVGGLVNSSIPVSCNAPSLSKPGALVTTTSTGTVSATFTVIEGTVGPPCGPAPAAATCPATDAANNSPITDAALYPCPPTAAQQAKGDVCTLTYGDEANDSGVANISFASSAPSTTVAPTTTPTAPTTTKAPATTTATTPTTVAPSTGVTTATTAPAPSTAPSTGTLASTGPGPAVGWLGAIGVALLLLGLVLLFVLLEGPRRALAGIAVPNRLRKLSLPIHRDPDGSMARQMAGTASKWVGHADQLGRRLGERASGAPVAARGLSHRVASASVRTAAWLLGR